MTCSCCSRWSALLKANRLCHEMNLRRTIAPWAATLEEKGNVNGREIAPTVLNKKNSYFPHISPTNWYQGQPLHDPNTSRPSAYDPVRLHQIWTAWIFEVAQDVTLVSQRFTLSKETATSNSDQYVLVRQWAQVWGCAGGVGGGRLVDKDEQVSSQGH